MMAVSAPVEQLITNQCTVSVVVVVSAEEKYPITRSFVDVSELLICKN